MFSWLRFSARLLIVVAIEICLGILFMLFPTWFKLLPGLWVSLFSAVGVSFFAAAILTSTLEPLTRERIYQNAVRELQKLSTDQMLSALSGDARVFEEIQNYVIRQNFIIKNFRLTVQLKWMDDRKRYVHKRRTAYYLVENLSSNDLPYDKVVFEERENEEIFPGCTKITDIKVFDVDPVTGALKSVLKSYSAQEIESFITQRGQFLRLEIPNIIVPSDTPIGIKSEVEAVNDANYHYPYILAKIADGMEITVTHPEDLDVRATPLHPATERFRMLDQSETLKRWVIETGILPYQGVELNWRVAIEESAQGGPETKRHNDGIYTQDP